MGQERRKYPRFALHQMVEVSFDRESFVNAEGINISKDGLLCRTEEPIDLYATVELLLEITFHDKTENIQTEGVVLRNEQKSDGTYDVGIQFSTDEPHPALLEYVGQLEK